MHFSVQKRFSTKGSIHFSWFSSILKLVLLSNVIRAPWKYQDTDISWCWFLQNRTLKLPSDTKKWVVATRDGYKLSPGCPPFPAPCSSPPSLQPHRYHWGFCCQAATQRGEINRPDEMVLSGSYVEDLAALLLFAAKQRGQHASVTSNRATSHWMNWQISPAVD